jgi:O-antigen biosynthesis protein WbqP
MKRIFDLAAAIFLLILLIAPMLVIALAIKFTSKGPILHKSDRVGLNNSIFKMYKFRTMRIDTPAVATHLLKDPNKYITPVGSFLRRLSLDELPQLFNIVSGEMAFVGPRPALFNQNDLIRLRTEKNIHKLIPGVTGWAQVNGRDTLPIPVKVEFDEYYLKNRSFALDARIMLMTIIKAICGEGVHH